MPNKTPSAVVLYGADGQPISRDLASRTAPPAATKSAGSMTFFTDSLAIREHTFNADPIPVYPFKFFIPLAGMILLLQGLVEIARCIICIREGAWPSREQDVEEVDVDKLKAMVNVKDEDIEALDKFVVREGAKP